ncbi:uncharacterized protein LOC143362145 isoform X2 [Halictus rubicundus]|uniref:uncharacterized protein LOC143362145 isoform X2 n=1 Tax=Halictus rubicundus TaxID=77578 RepID=UPI004035D812
MKKNTRHQHHVGTSQSNLRAKPYGFCCDVKEHDPKLDMKNGLGSLFSRHNLTGEGPNIKFRCQEINTVSTSLQRLNQKSLHRLGSRARQRGRQRGGYDDMFRDGQRGRNQENGNENHLREQLICERCRGPLRWYLEDEIDAARDIMMQERKKKHNIETEYNIKIAKKKDITTALHNTLSFV